MTDAEDILFSLVCFAGVIGLLYFYYSFVYKPEIDLCNTMHGVLIRTAGGLKCVKLEVLK